MEGPTATAARCPVCRGALAGEARTPCPSCGTAYHADCWAENGGCAVYGCKSVPATEARSALEIPPAYWGQEEKQCPSCGTTIAAAARRCRSCGTMFAGAQPQSAGEFRRKQQLDRRGSGLRRMVIGLFALSVLPCTAPLAALFGWIWYRSEREAVASLPPLYSGLCRLALVVGAGQTAAIAVVVTLYALLRA
jgi:hypothetical protein